MDKHYEDPKILNLCSKAYDISNLSHDREIKARDMWNKSLGYIVNHTGEVKQKKTNPMNAKEYNAMIDRIGLYMINEDYMVLKRRFKFADAIKEYIKKKLLTVRAIRKSTTKEYEAFQNWVLFKITGNTPESLKKKNEMDSLADQVYELMEQMKIKPEQCLEWLQTYLAEQAGKLNT